MNICTVHIHNPPYKKRWRHVDLKNIFPQILIGCKNIKTIFNEPYKFNKICLLSHEIFCWQGNVLFVKIMNFSLARSTCRCLSNYSSFCICLQQ